MMMMTMDCRTLQVKMCFLFISIGNVHHHYHHYHLLYFIEHGGDQQPKHDDDEQHGQADDNKQCGDARQNTV